MQLSLIEIAQAVQGQLLGDDTKITGISIDSRTIKTDELYIALKGKNFDGHSFISAAGQAGAKAVIVEHVCDTPLTQIVVEDSRLALAALAAYWRKSLPLKVVGITGSNGKTTVKEMIASILATQGNTLFTKGNLNNDIGVPLTLLKLDAQHEYAVIEMGANHLGEIAYSSIIAQADVAVITNVGPAHIEGFGSIEAIAAGKGEIIASLGTTGIAVLNRDDKFYEFWRNLADSHKIASFGFNQAADVSAQHISTVLGEQGFETHFQLQAAAASIQIKLMLAGEHNVKNALAAAAATMQLGVGLADIKVGLEQVKPVTGRMQPLRGRKGGVVIDDTYNANPASLKAALCTLNHQDSNWLVLGAFGELGDNSSLIHKEMGEMIRTMPVQRLFAVGKFADQTVQAFGAGGQFFDTQEQLIAVLNQEISGKETVLIKGSRLQKMENVVAAMVDNFRAA